MTTKRANEIKDIKEGLHSIQEVLILKALDKMETKGDASLIPDVITLWVDADDAQIKKRTETLMYGLKDTAALETLVAYLATDASEEKKWLALNAIWQSGFDASPFLSTLVDYALNNSYTNAMDIMTIIEVSEFKGEYDDLIDENLKKINTFIKMDKSDNLSLILEIKSILVDKKIAG